MDPSSASDPPEPWWGSVSLDEGSGGRWEVGPSTLWLYRSAREWRLHHRPPPNPTATDPMLNRSGVWVPVPPDDPAAFGAADDATEVTRHSFRHTEARISLQPTLADRPVVSRPEHPLYIPSGESVTLYLSTALWIQVRLAESGRLLQEVPSFRMSDTWFGPSTIEGSLCYATRTAGRLHLDCLPRRFHRAVTPLRLKNTAADALALERVQLPVQHLALYTGPEQQLWTQAVTMTRRAHQDGADIQIRSGSPAEADDASLVQSPRTSVKKGLFTSTFGAVGTLFGS